MADLTIAAELAAATKALAPALKRLKAATAKMTPEKMKPGALADALYEMEQVSKQLKVLSAPFDDVLDPKIKEVEEHFIRTLEVGEMSGVQGLAARVQITDAVIPTVDDWEKFYAHIKKTGNFELLNRAPNRKAITERWDAKKQVPGVGKFVKKSVSCTKLGNPRK